MKQRARKETPERTWTIRTEGTYMIHARVPHELRDRLKAYVDATAYTITDTMIAALEKYLKERGF